MLILIYLINFQENRKSNIDHTDKTRLVRGSIKIEFTIQHPRWFMYIEKNAKFNFPSYLKLVSSIGIPEIYMHRPITNKTNTIQGIVKYITLLY